MSDRGVFEAPIVDMPVVPGPGDCLPDVLAAGRAAPLVKVDYYGGVSWVVCDGELARAALSDRRLSKDMALAPQWIRVPGVMLGAQPDADVARAMVMSEGNDHERIKRLHAPHFTPRRVAEWRVRIEELVGHLLDQLSVAGDEVDLVQSYAFPLPLGFFSGLLGLPSELEPVLHRITDQIMFSTDQDVRAEAIGALAEAVAGWARDPDRFQPGIITGFLDARDTDGVTMNEVVTWTTGLVMAGFESTASLIASAILEALRCPPHQRPGTETEIKNWVEETLRVQPPLPHATWRFATEDIELGGYLIPSGAPVQIALASANRCPHSSDEDAFDASSGRGHVSFGLGKHYCLGAPLARLETTIALRAFLARFPDARLSATREVGWDSDWIIRRINTLPVVLNGQSHP